MTKQPPQFGPISVDALDALLPQTQCQLCEYPGCRPYAEALAAGHAPINRCLPGGVETLNALGATLNCDPAPFVEDMIAKTKAPTRAVIREDECIGCTKCIQACPLDAIIGRSKRMHTVLTDACSGCELCIPPCPVDCIDLVPLPPLSPSAKQAKAKQWRSQLQQRNRRLAQIDTQQATQHQHAKQGDSEQTTTQAGRQAALQAALARVRKKRQSSC